MSVGTGEPPRGGLTATVRGSLVLAIATIGSQVVGFVMLAIVARRIGPDNLGDYAFAMALTGYFGLPVNFGVGWLAVREVAQAPERARQLMGDVLVIGLTGATISYGLLVTAGVALSPSQLAGDLLPVVGLTLFVTAVNLDWALRGLGRMGAAAVCLLGGQLLYGALVPFLVTEGRSGTFAYAALNVAGLLFAAAATAVAVVRAAGRPRPRLELAALWERVRRSAPFGLSLAMIAIYYRFDTLLLGWLSTSADVAIYTTASKIPLALIALAGVWVSAFYPHSAVLAEQDPARLRRDVGLVSTFAIVLAAVLTVGAAFSGRELMVVLFGDPFSDAGPPFVVLVATAGLVLISVTFGNVLVAGGQERYFLLGVTVGAVANIVLNLAAIPLFGPLGAAVVTLISEALVMAMMIRRFRQSLGLPRLEWSRLARAVPGLLAMVACLELLSGLEVVARVVLGGMAFVAGAAALRVLTLDELRRLLPTRTGRAPVR